MIAYEYSVLGQLGLCQLLLHLLFSPPPLWTLARAGGRKPRSLAAARHVLVRRFSNTGLGFMRWGLSAISSPQAERGRLVAQAVACAKFESCQMHRTA